MKFCSKNILYLIFLFYFGGSSQDIEKIINSLQEIIWDYNSEKISVIEKWIITQNYDGSWSEFNYGVLSTADSDANLHLYRLLMIAKEVSNSDSSKFNNPKYINSIEQGLQFWLNSKTIDVNWWDNLIKFPKTIGEILIVMKDTKGWTSSNQNQLEKKLVDTFKPIEVKDLSSYGKGSNMLDFALHYIYRGVLTSDFELIANTSEFISNNLETNIQEDLSFHQHGDQMHIASYGFEFSKALINIAFCLKSTPAKLDLTSPSLSKAFDFINKTQLNSFRGEYWDYNVVGRGISRFKGTYLDSSFFSMVRKIKIIQEDNREIIFNQYPELHQHFWKSDYTQHIRKDYTFNIRTLSDRTVETETRRGENLKGNYLCYGSYFISKDGKEYESVIPVWDWSMIPGITINRTNYFPIRSNDKNANYGSTSFVGGLSDGKYGVSVFQADMDSIKVNKGWFFFDDEIVCLGSGIKSNSYIDLRTTVNQCLGKKKYTVIEQNNNIKKVKGTFQGNFKWVIHNNYGYYFPNDQNINVSLKTEVANLKEINSKEKDTIIKKRVFKLWINHFEEMGEYAYVVVPNISSKLNTEKDIEAPKIDILANNEYFQAVRHNGLGIVQIIFYKKTKFKYDSISIEVSDPCLLMINNKEIIACDPNQKLNSLDVKIDYAIKKISRNYIFLFEDKQRGSSVFKSFDLYSDSRN